MATRNYVEASRLGGKLAENAFDDDFDLFTTVVTAKLLAGDAKGAVPVAERLLQRDPYGWQSNRLAALVFSRGGQAERGEKMMTDIAKRYPRESSFKNQLAEARLNAGLIAAAEAPAREALALDPKVPENHALLGNILVRLDRYHEAVTAFGESVRLNPTRADNWNSLALALDRDKQAKDAIAAAERASALAPNSPLFSANLGFLLMKSHQWAPSTTAFRRAVNIKADEAPWWNNLGITLLQQKKNKDAVMAFETAAKLAPQSRAMWQNLAESLRLAGNAARAQVAIEKARTLPRDQEVLLFK